MRFDWDAQKARSNLRKHGVTFREAATVFRDPLFVVFDDPDHSQTENRYIIIGHSEENHLLIAGYVERADKVRLIWARKTTKRERKIYEARLKEEW